jgi:hypothetical protein
VFYDLAAVFDAPNCSAVVVRTTQRFLPPGVTFDPEHLRQVDAGRPLPRIVVVAASPGDDAGGGLEC